MGILQRLDDMLHRDELAREEALGDFSEAPSRTKYIRVIDESVDYQIEWCVWKRPYLRIIAGWIEL